MITKREADIRYKTMNDMGNLTAKTVLVRVDLNVPLQNGVVLDNTRIMSVVPTVKRLLSLRPAPNVLLLSHFGQPKAGGLKNLSLVPLIKPLEIALDCKVAFIRNCDPHVVRQIFDSGAKIVLMENLRFNQGEVANDPSFAKLLASMGHCYINDAFSCSHREHASIVGIPSYLPSFAGLSLEAELTALESALDQRSNSIAAIIGGAKVSTKLGVLQGLITKVNYLIIGGGMANTFLLAQGFGVGNSLCEPILVPIAKSILSEAKASSCQIILPTDVVVANACTSDAETRVCSVNHVQNSELILDTGPKSIQNIISLLESVEKLVWNGPLGAFEISPFDAGTVILSQQVARLSRMGELYSIAGGGDTLAALSHAGVKSDITHISSAGGAFIEWITGRTLPGVEALYKK